MPYLEKKLPWVKFRLPKWVITAKALVQQKSGSQVTVLHIVIAKEWDTTWFVEDRQGDLSLCHKSLEMKLASSCGFLVKDNLLKECEISTVVFWCNFQEN